MIGTPVLVYCFYMSERNFDVSSFPTCQIQYAAATYPHSFIRKSNHPIPNTVYLYLSIRRHIYLSI